MIVFLSDLDLTGSGYMNIAVSLTKELVNRGKKVTVLGLGYNGQEHNWPFQVLPIMRGQWMAHAPAMIANLHNLSLDGFVEPIDALVIALDIPLQIGLRNRLKAQLLEQTRIEEIPFPIISIFPVEDAPVMNTWAHNLGYSDSNLVISQYGQNALEEAGVESKHIRIGLDTEAWRLPIIADATMGSEEEKASIRRAMGYTDEDYLIVTVADNQERKNLSAAMDMIAEARKKHRRIFWHLVTRKDSLAGWNLEDYALEKGMTGNLVLWDRGISHADLWRVMVMSDLFLLTSKAEGLCMPVMEAMACGVPVLVSHCSAFLEHVHPNLDKKKFKKNKDFFGERGVTIPIEFKNRDVWGNSWRSYVDIDRGTNILEKMIDFHFKKSPALGYMTANARQYVVERDHEESGDLLNAEIDRLVKEFRTEHNDVFGEIVPGSPAVVPSVVPVVGEEQKDG